MALARKAMENLEIEQAIRVYREMRETAMVLALQEILYIEDKHLIAGHVCLLLEDYQKAQSLFLSSSQPIAALHMRRDLLDWSPLSCPNVLSAPLIQPCLVCRPLLVVGAYGLFCFVVPLSQ